MHHALIAWLQHRRCTRPHTPNRHVLVSTVTATGTAPVSDYLSWHLLLCGVQLEQIRGDRVLPEALAVRADPLHLAAMFNLSSTTAIAYTDIARSLLERPIEATRSRPRRPRRPRSIPETCAESGPRISTRFRDRAVCSNRTRSRSWAAETGGFVLTTVHSG